MKTKEQGQTDYYRKFIKRTQGRNTSRGDETRHYNGIAL